MPFSDDELESFYREIEARTAAQEQARRAPRRRIEYVACPTPDKQPYASPGAARDGIDRLRRQLIGTSTQQLRIYECSCGAWHITSSAQLIYRSGPASEPRRRKGKKKR